VRLSRDTEEAQEPFVEAGQLPFAQLLRYFDEPEEREDDDQDRHEDGGLLPGEPSGAETAGVTGQVGCVTQVAARLEVSQRAADSKVSHDFTVPSPRARA
jgi:hypothetical protein